MLKLALLLLAAVDPQQFDLVCSGTVTTKGVLVPQTTAAYSAHYRIDIAARKWCEGECKSLAVIADIQPTSIALTPEENVDTATERRYSSSRINRETGEESQFYSSGRHADMLSTDTKGSCEKRPFSGFPEFKTKF